MKIGNKYLFVITELMLLTITDKANLFLTGVSFNSLKSDDR